MKVSTRARALSQRHTSFLAFCTLCLGLAGLVLATTPAPNNPSNSPENDPPKDQCSATGQGSGGPATSGDPVLIRKGASIERALDLYLPGPSFPWYHKRSYQSDYGPKPGGNALAYIQGERWEGGMNTMFLKQEDVDGDSQSDDIVLYLDATAKRSFTNTGTGYGTPGDMVATLTHDAVNDEFILEYILSGDRFIFHDFTVTPTGKRGLIKARSDRYGMEEITFTYNDTEKRITEVTTPQGAVIEYDYIPAGGPDGGRIQKIDVRAYANGPVIQRARYTYWFSDLNHSPDLGTTSDLLMV